MTDDASRRRRKLSAIMMADVCGFSRMMGEDDERTVDLIQDFHRRLEARIGECEGRVVDTSGDSVLGEFDSVVNAVFCAQRIQEDLGALNAARPNGERISTRIGVHLGDVIVEDYNVYGDGVNIAARLEPLAEPGGICISEAVYLQVRDRLEVEVQDCGLQELKNIQYPVRIFKIHPLAMPVDVVPEVVPEVVPRQKATPLMSVPVAEGRLPASWTATLLRSSNVSLLAVGTALLLSPLILFPTGGVLQTGGAILVAVALGRVWARTSHNPQRFLVALGAGIASAAVFTNWSRVTNVLFVLAGVIVASVRGGRLRRPSR